MKKIPLYVNLDIPWRAFENPEKPCDAYAELLRLFDGSGPNNLGTYVRPTVVVAIPDFIHLEYMDDSDTELTDTLRCQIASRLAAITNVIGLDAPMCLLLQPSWFGDVTSSPYRDLLFGSLRYLAELECIKCRPGLPVIFSFEGLVFDEEGAPGSCCTYSVLDEQSRLELDKEFPYLRFGSTHKYPNTESEVADLLANTTGVFSCPDFIRCVVHSGDDILRRLDKVINLFNIPAQHGIIAFPGLEFDMWKMGDLFCDLYSRLPDAVPAIELKITNTEIPILESVLCNFFNIPFQKEVASHSIPKN